MGGGGLYFFVNACTYNIKIYARAWHINKITKWYAIPRHIIRIILYPRTVTHNVCALTINYSVNTVCEYVYTYNTRICARAERVFIDFVSTVIVVLEFFPGQRDPVHNLLFNTFIMDECKGKKGRLETLKILGRDPFFFLVWWSTVWFSYSRSLTFHSLVLLG